MGLHPPLEKSLGASAPLRFPQYSRKLGGKISSVRQEALELSFQLRDSGHIHTVDSEIYMFLES